MDRSKLNIKSIYQLKSKEGGITKETYDKKHQELQDKLQLLNTQLEEYTKTDYDYQPTVSTVISVARRSRKIFEKCSEPSEKRAFLNLLLQNPVLKEKKLDFKLASPFNLVLELADNPTRLREMNYVRPYLINL